MSRTPTLFLSALLIAASSTALAADARIELTPMLGYRFNGEIVAENTNFLTRDLEVEASAVYSLSMAVPLVNSLAFELFYGAQQTDLISDGGLFADDYVFGEIDVDYWHAGLQWRWERGDIQPYVGLGLGIAQLSLDAPGARDEDVFSTSFSGGVTFELTPRLGLRLDGRGFWANTDHNRHDFDECDSDCFEARYDDDLFQAQFSAGLRIQF